MVIREIKRSNALSFGLKKAELRSGALEYDRYIDFYSLDNNLWLDVASQ